MERSKRVVIFDYDGPIVQSLSTQFEWYRYICAKTNKPFPYKHPVDIRWPDIGNYIAAYARLGFDWSVDKDFIWKEYLAFFAKQTVPFVPGVRKQLRLLQNNGYVLAIASSNQIDAITNRLEAGKVLSCFSAIVGHSKEKGDALLKPHPQCILETLDALGALPSDAVYIGDAATDIIAARRVAEHRAVSVPSIGIGWGWSDPAVLLAENPTRLIRRVSELAATVDELFAR